MRANLGSKFKFAHNSAQSHVSIFCSILFLKLLAPRSPKSGPSIGHTIHHSVFSFLIHFLSRFLSDQFSFSILIRLNIVRWAVERPCADQEQAFRLQTAKLKQKRITRHKTTCNISIH